MGKRSVTEAAVHGRRVLVRVDYNVPQRADGSVADDRRIVESLPTLRHLQAAGARTILLSHLGRPDGRRDMRFTLRPVVHALSQRLGLPVPLASDCIGIEAIQAAAKLQNGQFLMLENLRFHPGEETNDPAFVGQLAQLGDLFVEEAFGTVHRAHASTAGLPKRLPAFAGLLVEREIRELAGLRDGPARPYVALLGGAKVADKLPLLESFLGKADALLVGGALAFPFLAADGRSLGATKVEEGLGEAVAAFRSAARDRSTELLLPEDLVVEAGAGGEISVVPVDAVPPGALARDIGPATRTRFLDRLRGSATVFWNGPLGLAEEPRFAGGTREVLVGLGAIPGHHVGAGGDSARVAQELGAGASFQYLSTGGGAALEFVQGAELPGLAVLPDAP